MKKAGIVGKYGTQYGASLRKQMKKMEVIQHSKYFCELCGKFAVKREAVGICICKDCGKVKAGGAYTLKLRKEITELGHQCFLEVKEISGDCECHVQGRQRKDLDTIQRSLNEDGAPQEVDRLQAWKCKTKGRPQGFGWPQRMGNSS